MSQKPIRIIHFVVLILICSLFLSTANAQVRDKKQKKRDDRYVQEEAEFEVDVNYRVLDVTALDEKGRHVLDLKKDDFILKIGKNKISIASLDHIDYIRKDFTRLEAKQADSGSAVSRHKEQQILKQPLRTYVIVFANLPYLPKRWFILRDGLLNYLQYGIGDNVQIAVYSMGIDELALIQPFTIHKRNVMKVVYKYLTSRWGEARKNETPYTDGISRVYDLDEEPDGMKIMADAPDPEIDHSNSSWIISDNGYAELTKNTFYQILKQFNILVNRLGDIPGKKNILLFSEGFPYLPNYSLNSSQPSDFIETRSRIQALISKMSKNNTCLYTFDMLTDRITDYWDSDKIDKGIPFNINLIASKRQALISNISRESGGAFFRFLGNDSNRISVKLKSMDMHSACYYLVGFYVNDIDMESKLPITLETTRKGVTLSYKKWMDDREVFSGYDRYLNEVEAARKIFDRHAYDEFKFDTKIGLIPAPENKVWINIGISADLESLLYPREEEIRKTLDDEMSEEEFKAALQEKEIEVLIPIPGKLDAQLALELTKNGARRQLIAVKEIEDDYQILGKKITYNYRVLVEPGEYSLKAGLHSTHNLRTATKNFKITVPDLSKDKNLHTMFILDTPNYEKVYLKNEKPFSLEEKARTSLEIIIDSDEKSLGVAAEFDESGFEFLEFIMVYNKLKTPEPVLGLLDENGKRIKEFELKAIKHSETALPGGYSIIRGSLHPGKLKKGNYRLISSMGDVELSSAQFEVSAE